MPINNADIPIADNEPEIKIDNPVERVYLYRVVSAPTFVTPPISNLRFYKYKQKFNGLDTLISEDGIYYLYASRIAGNLGSWAISPIFGSSTSAANRFAGATNGNFFTTKVPIEGSYSSFAGSVALVRITSDTR